MSRLEKGMIWTFRASIVIALLTSIMISKSISQVTTQDIQIEVMDMRDYPSRITLDSPTMIPDSVRHLISVEYLMNQYEGSIRETNIISPLTYPAIEPLKPTYEGFKIWLKRKYDN